MAGPYTGVTMAITSKAAEGRAIVVSQRDGRGYPSFFACLRRCATLMNGKSSARDISQAAGVELIFLT
jgi:hypothetical protein